MRAGSQSQGRFLRESERQQHALHGIHARPTTGSSENPLKGGATAIVPVAAPQAAPFHEQAAEEKNGGRRRFAAMHSVAPLHSADAAELLALSSRDRDQSGEHHLPAASLLHLLIVDEDEAVLRAICEIAEDMGFRVHAASNVSAATELVERHSLDVVLMDLRSRDGGLPLLEHMRSRFPRVPIVVMTAFATVNSAVDAMRLGATDYLTKPFAMEELTGTLRNAAQHRQFDVETRRLQETLQGDAGSRGIIGTSAAMQKLLRIVSKVAFATHPVLIAGESGTGKETIAKLIHCNGQAEPSSEGAHAKQETPSSPDPCPFLQVDCAAMTPSDMESEIFGYVHGEGTAEREERRGSLALEGGCTLYLEEIAAMPLDLQAKLLRALQEKKVRPVGSTSILPVTVRLIASSSRNLTQLVESGSFRKDLYFRLNVVNLRIPPLRERPEDIPLLAMFFLEKQALERGIDYRLDSDVLRVLDGYEWPGNVSELESAIERACSMSSGPMIFLNDLPTQLQGYRQQLGIETVRIDERTQAPGANAMTQARQGTAFGRTTPIIPIAEMEREAILSTIDKLNGDKLMAAKLLGIGKTTLYRKLKEYGIEED